MIEKTTSYKVGVAFFATLEQAQRAEILSILATEGTPDGMSPLEAAAAAIVTNAPKVIDILSTTPKSRVRARKANGATRKPRTTSKPAACPGFGAVLPVAS